MRENSARSMSIRAKINNFAKANGISPQHALQAFFTERFLARIEKSAYMKNLAVKGGTLMSAILGVAHRTTMDVDATVIGLPVDEEMVNKIVSEVAATDVGDGIRFKVDLTTSGKIRKDDDYGGFSIGMTAELGTIRLPIGMDVTFGDVITPRAEKRQFATIFDDKVKISVYAYTVETLIAEKLQTVLSRGDANTRPRDFYDLYMLGRGGTFDLPMLRQAVANTFANRHSEDALGSWRMVMAAVGESDAMRRQWERYRSNASYAKGVSFDAALSAVRNLFESLET